MYILKLILIGILVVFLAFIGLAMVSMTFTLLKYLFWLAVIGFVALALWKMFSPKGPKQEEKVEAQSKLANTEITLEEYKRKLEAQLGKNSKT
jgi:membrane protein implicated in regulation of membrane protease activity